MVATAWELIGSVPDDACVRIVGGRALYEDVIFYDNTPGDRVKLARIDVREDGLRQVNRYVDPDTLLELVPDSR